MTDQYLPPAPDQHDTAAYPRPLPPQAPVAGGYVPAGPGGAPGYPADGPGTAMGYGAGGPGWYVPEAQAPRSNPEADYWATRYRSQRRWTRVLVGMVVLALVGVLGLGAVAWRFATTNPLVTAASDLADAFGSGPGDLGGEGQGPGSTTPEDATPDGLLPEGGQPEGANPDGPDGLSGIPLPESLRELGSTLGITDVGQLLDLAVANGLLSPEDADQLRAALEAGVALQGLTDQGGQ